MSDIALPSPRETPLCLGHEAAMAAFMRAQARGRLPQAWVIQGPPGIGKATLAFALARRLLVPTGTAVAIDPDDAESAIFRQTAHASHPDLLTLERRPHPRTGRMQTEIVVDSVREVIDAMHKSAAWGERRVLVIDAIDELNRNAENALLKLVEEPRPGAVVLLVCHAPGSVPRTLLSRCARIALRAPEHATCMQVLEGLMPDERSDDLVRAAIFADNAPGEAARCLSMGLIVHYDMLLTALSDPGDATSKAFEFADKLAKLSAEIGVAPVVGVMGQLIRRAAQSAVGLSPGVALVDDEGERLRFAAQRPVAHWVAMWDKLAGLPQRIEGLNDDVSTTLFLALRALISGDARSFEL